MNPTIREENKPSFWFTHRGEGLRGAGGRRGWRGALRQARSSPAGVWDANLEGQFWLMEEGRRIGAHPAAVRPAENACKAE